MRSPLLTLGDRVRLARLGLRLATVRWDGVRDVPENGRSAEQELRARGFSDRAIEAFFRPFLAGIRLRRDLGVSAAAALFDVRMLLRGRAALPARGMRALPEALAHALPAELVRLQTPVLHLTHDPSGRVVGVRTPDAELRGPAVVLATDADTTARLTGLNVPRVELGSATLYLAGRQRPFTQKLLVLNALSNAFVNDATLLTNIAPEYAPRGWHLLAAHVLEANDLDDLTIETRARADLRRWFPHVDLAGWRTLALVRTPHSQFDQPPYDSGKLPSTRTRLSGLISGRRAHRGQQPQRRDAQRRGGRARGRERPPGAAAGVRRSTRGVTRMSLQRRERIVVVGAGYGGVGTALRLARIASRQTTIHLVDGRAEHQLITRLHEVAAGRLAPAAAAVPLRVLLAGTSVLLHRAWVEGIDVQRGRVFTSDGVLEYDRLVLAPGSQTDYRGVPGASQLTFPLRTLEDALRVRERLATLLRGRPGRAYSGKNGSELTVLVVGGGYTGVELAAELADLPGAECACAARRLARSRPALLPQSAAWLGNEAAASLERLGVQVFLDTPCLAVDRSGVQVAGGHIRADQVVCGDRCPSAGLAGGRWTSGKRRRPCARRSHAGGRRSPRSAGARGRRRSDGLARCRAAALRADRRAAGRSRG